MLLNPYRFLAAPVVPPDLADIQALFGGGVIGGFYDCTDESTLWNDAAMTTPATLNGTVRGITDLSGNGLHLTNSATTFTYKNDGTKSYLDCPGTSFLQAFTSTKATLGSSSGSYIGASYMATDYSAGMTLFAADKSGVYFTAGISTVSGSDEGSISSSFRQVGPGTLPIAETGAKSSGIDVVVGVRANTAGATIRRDGTLTASDSTSGTPATVSSSPLTLGAGFLNANNNYFNPFKGRCYGAILISSALSDAEVEMVENYFLSRLTP